MQSNSLVALVQITCVVRSHKQGQHLLCSARKEQKHLEDRNGSAFAALTLVSLLVFFYQTEARGTGQVNLLPTSNKRIYQFLVLLRMQPLRDRDRAKGHGQQGYFALLIAWLCYLRLEGRKKYV